MRRDKKEDIGKAAESVSPGGVHIVGSKFVECPMCQNRDLIMLVKGFVKVLPGSPQGQLIDPQTTFICVDNECRYIFDVGDWLKYDKEKADDSDADNVPQKED